MSERPGEPSPVPGDADLWPGKLPFTAFGQWGDDHLDLRVFDQSVLWVNRVGVAFRIDSEEMSDIYVANVITFLTDEANCTYFYRMTLRRDVLQMRGDLLRGKVPGDALAIAAGAAALTELSAREWLESTPLMRALRRRAERC